MSKVYEVTVKETDKKVSCKEDQFVLDAFWQSGNKALISGCHGGGCGICKAKVVKGEYAVAKKMSRAHISEQDEKAGIVLTCCIKPKSDLKILTNYE